NRPGKTGGDENVLGAHGDERGHADLGEPIERVVRADRVRLTREPDEPRWIWVIDRARDEELDELRVLRHGLPGEQPRHDGPRELLAVLAGPDAQEFGHEKSAIGVWPGQRAVELQGEDTPRLTQRDLLGDHAAHRRAADVRARDPERVQEA